MSHSRTRLKSVSKAHPCAVCGRDHKCSFGEDGLICCGRCQGKKDGFVHMGTSEKDGTWHYYRREDDPVILERQREYRETHPQRNGHVKDWNQLAATFRDALTPTRRDELANDLGVPVDVLSVLQVGWNGSEGCWTFPERDGTGRIIGISRRWKNGEKKRMSGGHSGLYIPPAWKERGGVILCPEGASNTLALWAMGVAAIGRPNNLGGKEDLAQLLSDVPAERDIIIVGDFDPKNSGDWPGRDGAVAVAAHLHEKLNRPILWALPPDKKDVREWLGAQTFDRLVSDCWEEAGETLLTKLRGGAHPADSYSVHSLYKERTEYESEKVPKPPVITPFSQLKACPDDTRWVWRGYLARSNITLLSALYKCGKTTLLSHLLHALANDGTFCGLTVNKSRVLCITEEHETFWADRRDRLGIGDHCSAIVRPFSTKPNEQQWITFLGHLKAIQERERYDLLLFDTLSNLWPVRDENNASEVRAALMPLPNVIGDASLLPTHQFRKSGGEEGTASRGSGELMASVDIILELRRLHPGDKNDRHRVLSYLGRHPDIPAELVVQMNEGGTEYVAEGDRQAVAARELREELIQELPTSPPGSSVEGILKNWQQSPKPKRENLYVELRRGAEATPPDWQREGEGVKGKPFTFWRDAPCEKEK